MDTTTTTMAAQREILGSILAAWRELDRIACDESATDAECDDAMDAYYDEIDAAAEWLACRPCCCAAPYCGALIPSLARIMRAEDLLASVEGTDAEALACDVRADALDAACEALDAACEIVGGSATVSDPGRRAA